MAGQRVGYIRVSTVDQSPGRQLDGVDLDRVFTDHASGRDSDRPQLQALLEFVRDGDTVLVHSMDRQARHLDDLRRLVRELTDRGVRVEFVTEHLVFAGQDSPMANLLLSVMGAFAEFERALIRESARGHRPGPPPRSLQGPQEVPLRRAGPRAHPPGRGGRAEGGPGPRVRNQPADGVRLSAGVTIMAEEGSGATPIRSRADMSSMTCP